MNTMEKNPLYYGKIGWIKDILLEHIYMIEKINLNIKKNGMMKKYLNYLLENIVICYLNIKTGIKD